MNRQETSVKELKKMLNKNNNLNSEEWNEYALKKEFLSAITIIAHENVLNWEELKKKLRKKDKKLDAKIEKARYELNKSIEETGLNSERTRQLSNKIDELINLYYETKEETYTRKQKEYPFDCKMIENYKKSYIELKEYCLKNNTFPTTKEWNDIAKKNKYLSCQAIEYVSGLTWNEIREKILKEI